MDLLHVVIRADTSGSERAAQSLNGMTTAARGADAAVRGVGSASAQASGAIGASAAATDRATASSRMRTAALQAEAAAERMAGMQRRNLIFQLNDIGVSLASGMNPMMVLIQQGSQIATIYEGGVVPALRETALMAGRAAVAFWPIALAIGAVVAALAGLTYEFNKTGDTHVSMLDVIQAGWEMFAETVGSIIGPLYQGLVTGLIWAWEQSAPVLKSWGNTIIGVFVGAYEHITSVWGNLPAYLTAVGKLAWNDLVKTFENDALVVNGKTIIPGLNLTDMYTPLEPHEFDAYANTSWAQGTDYLGNLGGEWDNRAEEIARARAELDGLGSSAGAANDNFHSLARDGIGTATSAIHAFAQAATSAFSNLGSGIIDAFKKGGDVGMNVLNMLLDKVGQLGENLLNQGLNGLFSGLMGGLFGGGGGLGGMFGHSASTPLGFGGTAGFYPAFPSFAGGGWTGDGARSGGLDGQGGYLAMVHPRERIIDTTRANQNDRGGGGGDMIIHNHIAVPAGTSPETAPALAREITKELRRQLPDAIERHNRNNLRRAS